MTRDIRGLLGWLLLAVVAVAAWWTFQWFRDPAGLPDFLAERHPRLGTRADAGERRSDDATVDGPGTQTVYRWRDAQGVSHYSDAPVRGAQSIRLREDLNIVPSTLPVGQEIPASAEGFDDEADSD